MTKLVQKYKEALNSIGVVENETGALDFTYLDEADTLQAFPVAVDGMPLVLPNKENLQANKMKEVVVFHPLSESVIRGESEVLQKFRSLLCVRFKTVFYALADWMVNTSIDPKAPKKFSPKQKAFFDILADSTVNTCKSLKGLTEASLGTDPASSLINIYLRRTGATFEGQKVTRAAIVSFPIMETKEVKDKKHIWCGVEMSQKDIRMLTELFEYLVPSISEPAECYNAGSNDTQAPYFDCLIHSFAKLIENLNNIILLLGDKFPMGKHLYTDTSWIQDFEPLSQYRGQIPALPYNDGQLLNKTPEPTVATATKVASTLAQPTQVGAISDPLKRLMEAVKTPDSPAQAVWGSQPEPEVGGDPYNKLMAAVYKKNGMPIPAGGFGTANQSGWGVPAQPQSASALRRKLQNERSAADSQWTGMVSSNW